MYLIFIIGILLMNYGVELLSAVLDIKNFREELPEEFLKVFDKEKYKESQRYSLDKIKFSIVDSSFGLLFTVSVILLGGFNYLDNFVRSFSSNTILLGLMFTGLIIVITKIVGIPFDLYRTFVIEEKYGFNKMTIKLFFIDMIKELLLTFIIGGVVLSLLLLFFEKTGDLGWIYSWIMVTGVSLLLQIIAPIWIMPLFNKFTPLESGELKDKIEKYAKEYNFLIEGIYTMDGSKRSSKLNAYFTGFGKNRRIVFFDTLIEELSSDEILSVLAHEMGHYKLKHIMKNMFISIATTGFMFYILSLFLGNQGLFTAFKMENISIYAGFIFFSFIFMPVNMLVGIVFNILSRKFEYEADEYSVKTAKNSDAMISALKKLSVKNMSNLTPHPFNVFVSYSHPPVIDRVKAIRKVK